MIELSAMPALCRWTGRPRGATAQGDPGYKATSVLLGDSGLALAFDDEKLSDLAGIPTPAAVMGEGLPGRLRAAGMVIKVERT